jgi:hypothetical protein
MLCLLEAHLTRVEFVHAVDYPSPPLLSVAWNGNGSHGRSRTCVGRLPYRGVEAASAAFRPGEIGCSHARRRSERRAGARRHALSDGACLSIPVGLGGHRRWYASEQFGRDEGNHWNCRPCDEKRHDGSGPRSASSAGRLETAERRAPSDQSDHLAAPRIRLRSARWRRRRQHDQPALRRRRYETELLAGARTSPARPLPGGARCLRKGSARGAHGRRTVWLAFDQHTCVVVVVRADGRGGLVRREDAPQAHPALLTHRTGRPRPVVLRHPQRRAAYRTDRQQQRIAASTERELCITPRIHLRG